MPQDIGDKIDGIVEEKSHKLLKRLPLILSLIAMIFIVLEIISIPIKTQNYIMLLSRMVGLIMAGFSIYLMTNLNKAKLAIMGFISVSIILVVFMKHYGYLAALLY